MAGENYINHIALVLDASASMRPVASELVKVADSQVAYLARRSKELDQETRVSVYTFADQVRCVVYDKDVLRLPSIAQHYRTGGMTALIDATLKSQDDLAQTPELYGDHSFLTFVLTDGEENKSHALPRTLEARLARLPDHWTVAVLVPDQRGKHEAKKFGFPGDNVAIWDSTTTRGVVEAGETIRRATDQFMIARATGVRGSRAIFSVGADTVNKSTVRAAKLKALTASEHSFIDVDRVAPIREFVEDHGLVYLIGRWYYQLTKTEKIQPQKSVAVVERKTGKVYVGQGARDMLGLPLTEVRVTPEYNPDFDVFVQSTSVNRKLVPGTRLLRVSGDGR